VTGPATAQPPDPAPLSGEALPSHPRLLELAYDEIAGWGEDDHEAAFRAFRRGADVLADQPPRTRELGIDGDALAEVLRRAARFGEPDRQAARRFFEEAFRPFLVVPPTGTGFFTGYYEPVVDGSRRRSPPFIHPLYGAPDDLVQFDPAEPPPGLEGMDRFARQTATGLSPYPDRQAIEAGFLEGRGLELVFLADPVDAFFIHIQGAARIRLAEGGDMRVTYTAKTGHPYTPIGRVLVERGALTRSEATMQGIRSWLAAHPAEAPAVMAANRSFIFFREAAVSDPALGPIAAAKVPLTAGRSLAVDRRLYGFHMPVFVETSVPEGDGTKSFQRLLVAQDTGSAIVGAARGDIFFGSGAEAGAIAGRMRAEGRFIAFVPRGTAPKAGEDP
jgi:membrane-bound lytic murein transglycosylase A